MELHSLPADLPALPPVVLQGIVTARSNARRLRCYRMMGSAPHGWR